MLDMIGDDGPNNSDRADRNLEHSIGLQVREMRKKLSMTVVELAREANLSIGMLSKIENGQTSASLTTLQNLARALNIPITSLFKKYENGRDPIHYRAGTAPIVERAGSKDGRTYRILGKSFDQDLTFDPYIITCLEHENSETPEQSHGMILIYVLKGRALFHHGENSYELAEGDSLYFDGSAPHGLVKILEGPLSMMQAIVHLNA